MVWLEGASSHAAYLGEGQARMRGGSRLPQGGHDGGRRWQRDGKPGSRESLTSGEKRTKEDERETLMSLLRFGNPSDDGR